MFSLVSGLYQAYLAPTQLNILVVGGAGVGKTTMLERIKVTQFSTKSKPQNRAPKNGGDIPNVPVHWLKHSSSIEDEKGNNVPPPPTPPSSSKDVAAPENKTTTTTTTATTKRSSWLCPAPSRYSDAGLKSDEEDELDVLVEGESDVFGNKAAAELGPIPSPAPKRKVRSSTKTSVSSLESVDLMDNAAKAAAKVATCCVDSGPETVPSSQDVDCGESDATGDVGTESSGTLSSVPPSVKEAEDAIAQAELQIEASEEEEYDLKPKAKMLPLTKIRRTIGMNLGKLNIQGAVCHFWDLGGRMHELWERYYLDSDAVIFVWKTPMGESGQADNGADSDDDARDARQESLLQQSLLEEVRSCIPDDVPFLVLGHLFLESSPQTDATGNSGKPKTDVLYSTARLLPHYHNPYQGLFFANAANGQGVRSAIEWLIPLARRQLKVREAVPVGEDVGDAK